MKSLYMRVLLLALIGTLAFGAIAVAQESHPAGDPAVAANESKVAGHPTGHRSEADLVLPDLGSVNFLGMSGDRLLMGGLVVCVFGLLFGLVMYMQLKKLPVHRSMLEISELIYETCKTYLVTQGKFILLLELFIGAIMVVYFGYLRDFDALRVVIILVASLVGIAGSYGVAWFGIRINTFANSRTAFASLKGKPFPTYSIPLRAGMSIGMLLISVELFIMLAILLFVPGDYAGPVFIGFAIGESLGAAALRIAGGIFTKIADIGSDLMKIVFNIKEDDARNPGVIADCVGDNAGDSVGPTADGFETYGVTGVALITFILLAVTDPTVQVQLLVWIFVMRVLMVITSAVSYFINEAFATGRYANADKMNFEAPLTSLVWLTSILSVAVTYVVSYLLIPNLGGDTTMWWRLSTIITCGTLAGAIIPELVKIFTSTESSHVKEVVTSSKEGGPSLNILSGLVAGNFSAYWIGLAIMALMAIAYVVSGAIPPIDAANPAAGGMMLAPAVFAFGLVAFGFLGMGPVTIAVDSYGPVTDNAQSVYELSRIEALPNIKEEIKRDFGFEPNFEKAKHFLEENDGAGNTFKATAKPVLIGTAVVGATTMIFAIILLLEDKGLLALSLTDAPVLLGLICGGSVI
ncbi:MAG TPA: sodium-translocating pyrophosphatase, partial [Thermoanaerobaculia bacterium]|nr:sodium-translocating pyrophosphatase [Thermoanaerobaculia bacterium]